MTLPDLRPSQYTCRILAIDNGTDQVGFCVADYNILNDEITIIHCETYKVPSNYKKIRPATCQTRSNLHARLSFIAEHYIELLFTYQPDLIGCEAPFGHRMMNAFRTLTIAIEMFDDISLEYLPHVDFIRITPMEAKRAACEGNKFSVRKEDVHRYLFKDPKIITPKHIKLRNLGEDALDSITVAKAMGYYMVF